MAEIEDIGPLRKSVSVRRSPAEAFEIFTAGISGWWPLAKYSISQSRAMSCAIEPRVGGDVYEVRDDGERCLWGQVRAWEPPRRFVITWHPTGTPDTAQEVEVRFLSEGSGTRVELEHRGWAKLGERARAVRESYEGGWAVLLGKHYLEACGA
jgi:uncharacterized protein YndB with AHSA1/START domain